jgi:hypothetical protein
MKCQECGKKIEKQPGKVPDWLWRTWKEEVEEDNVRFGPYCEECVEESDNECKVCNGYTDRFTKDYREGDVTMHKLMVCPRCVHLNDKTWWALYNHPDLSLEELERGEAHIETKVVRS